MLKMDSVFNKRQDCCGCGACFNICPRNAIAMEEDEQGFLYPVIDKKKCVDCGLCVKVCQIGKEKDTLYHKAEQCYGIKHCDEIRKNSSSGGIYTAVSDKVIDDLKGACAGVRYDENFNVVHSLAFNSGERDCFRGSKYVQSDVGEIYKKVSALLKEDKTVLFSGTPCQVTALRRYLYELHIDEKNLITADIVCHGSPSPKIWRDYIKTIEDKYKGKLTGYTFRNKEAGWRGYHIKAQFDNGITVADNDVTYSYAVLFGADVMLRPSCYYCPYSSLGRCGDITIGDFWGIEKIDSDFSDNKGISMAFANSPKGEKIIEDVIKQNSLVYKKYSTNCLTQPNLYGSTDYSEYYDMFWQDYNKKGFIKVAKKYGGMGKFAKYYYYKRAIRTKLKRLK